MSAAAMVKLLLLSLQLLQPGVKTSLKKGKRAATAAARPRPVPDEGPEGRGAQPHVALDPQEADEEPGDALHQPQVAELLGVLGVNLLQAQRRQGALVRAPFLRLRLRGNLLTVLRTAGPQLVTAATSRRAGMRARRLAARRTSC